MKITITSVEQSPVGISTTQNLSEDGIEELLSKKGYEAEEYEIEG